MVIKRTIAFFSGSPMGYFAGNFFAGSQTGEPGLLKSLIFDLGSWKLHFHHWLIGFLSILFLLFFIRKRYNWSPFFFAFVFGFSVGLIFQGILSYSDWHQVFIKF